MSRPNYLLPALLLVILVIADQLFKYWTKQGGIELPGIVYSTHLRGLAWFGLASLVLLLLVFWLAKPRLPFTGSEKFALVLIIAGGASNIIDYIRNQAVQNVFSYHLALFNAADLMVLVGCVIIIFNTLTVYRREKD